MKAASPNAMGQPVFGAAMSAAGRRVMQRLLDDLDASNREVSGRHGGGMIADSAMVLSSAPELAARGTAITGVRRYTVVLSVN